MQYYFSTDGTTQQGPLDAGGLRAAGIGPATMVWREGMPDWQPAGEVPELAGMFAGVAPPPSPVPQSSASPPAAGPTPHPQHSPPHGSPHGHPPAHPPGGYPRTAGNNGMAIASFVLGLVGLTGFCYWCPFVTSILAIVFGHIARGQIRRGLGTGDGFALAGLVLGYSGIVLSLIGISLELSGHGVRFEGMPNFRIPL